MRLKIIDFSASVTLKFGGWPRKTIGHLFSLLYYAKLCASFEIHCWFPTGVTVWKHSIQVKSLVPCKLEIWWMTLEKNRAPLLYWAKLCASFQSHGWIQTGDIIWKLSIQVKVSHFFIPCDIGIWQVPVKNNRAPLLYHIDLNQSHGWFQTWVRVQKCSIRVNLTFLSYVASKFNGLPWKTI